MANYKASSTILITYSSENYSATTIESISSIIKLFGKTVYCCKCDCIEDVDYYRRLTNIKDIHILSVDMTGLEYACYGKARTIKSISFFKNNDDTSVKRNIKWKLDREGDSIESRFVDIEMIKKGDWTAWLDQIENENVYDKLQVNTFGHFQVIYKGEQINFEKKKSKELFALLVDRNGASVSREEIENNLWEGTCGEKRRDGTVQKVISSMIKSLELIDKSNIINRQRDSISIKTEFIDCDYFEVLRNKQDAIDSYHGLYMIDYPWAEYTNGLLTQIKLSEHQKR